MFKPLADKMLVKRDEARETTDSGIYIPDGAKDVMQFGTVIAAGPGAFLPDGTVRPLEVKAGDRVLFGKYVGYEFELNGEKVMIMDEEDVAAVVEN